MFQTSHNVCSMLFEFFTFSFHLFLFLFLITEESLFSVERVCSITHIIVLGGFYLFIFFYYGEKCISNITQHVSIISFVFRWISEERVCSLTPTIGFFFFIFLLFLWIMEESVFQTSHNVFTSSVFVFRCILEKGVP